MGRRRQREGALEITEKEGKNIKEILEVEETKAAPQSLGLVMGIDKPRKQAKVAEEYNTEVSLE